MADKVIKTNLVCLIRLTGLGAVVFSKNNLFHTGEQDFHLWLSCSWCLSICPGGGLPRHRTCDAAVWVLCEGSQQQVGEWCHGGAFPAKHRHKWLWGIRGGSVLTFANKKLMLLWFSFPCFISDSPVKIRLEPQKVLKITDPKCLCTAAQKVCFLSSVSLEKMIIWFFILTNILPFSVWTAWTNFISNCKKLTAFLFFFFFVRIHGRRSR